MASMRSALARPRWMSSSHEAEPLERSEERWMSEEEARRTEASLFSHSAIDTPVNPSQRVKPIGSPFEIPSSLPVDGPTGPEEEV